MNAEQRFCPVCSKGFDAGEAVLRCGGCGILHHPTCWVRNGGCATDRVHAESAEPLAFQPDQPPLPREPHPAEGTRLRRQHPEEEIPVIGRSPGPPGAADIRPEDSDREFEERVEGEVEEGLSFESRYETELDEDYFEEDEEPPDHEEQRVEVPLRHQAPVLEEPRPVRHGRYEPLEIVPMRRPLPSIYRRNRILRLWYIPAALLLGALVAVAVVFVVDYFAGDEGGVPPAGLPTATLPPASPTDAVSPTTGPSPTPSPTTTAATSPTPVTPTITPLPGQFLFGPGDRVVVVGTGDCLRVRDAPTTRGGQISCLADGTEAVILSGPAEADGYRWWFVRAPGVADEGWVAEDYLSRAP